MRASMSQLTPQFSTNRAVREYTEQHYLPAAATYLQRAADNGKIGTDLLNWQHELDQKWKGLRFGEIKLASDKKKHVFEAQVYLDDLPPEYVRVELYADGYNGALAEKIEMKQMQQLVGAVNGYTYRAEVPATRPAADYTARILPHRAGVSAPLESARILWQR
jgi:starch phosphorylase